MSARERTLAVLAQHGTYRVLTRRFDDKVVREGWQCLGCDARFEDSEEASKVEHKVDMLIEAGLLVDDAP